MGRRLGQHFLVRETILASIASAACPEPGETVIEIGPGRGALTAHLLERAGRVVAIEIDPVLAQYVREKFRESPKLEVVEADVLRAPLDGYGPVTVAGNLPYYITSPIVDKTLELGGLLRRAVFLVQQEVARRLAAAPGTRDYGYLSVLAQCQAEVSVLFPVSRAAFRPPPKVDSAVVRLLPRAEGSSRAEVAALKKFAGLCFRQKRKTIRNNLLGTYPKDRLDGIEEAGRRAEQLSLAELAALHRKLGGG
jgi:16S rRNA (adenine1518-N6/adenine1519-N6)-dimethyltransferase